jgi:hypothetical protein
VLPFAFRSANFFDLTGFPGLVEPRLSGSREPQDDVAALARHLLHLVAFPALWSLRAEVDIDGRVGIDDDALLLTANARKLLIRLKQSAA